MTVYLAEWKLAAELNLSIITSWRRFFCVVLVSWCSHESRSNSWKTPCCPAKLNINTLVTNERTVYWPVLTSVLLWKQSEPRKCIIFNPFLQVWQQYFSEFSSSVAQWCMKHAHTDVTFTPISFCCSVQQIHIIDLNHMSEICVVNIFTLALNSWWSCGFWLEWLDFAHKILLSNGKCD